MKSKRRVACWVSRKEQEVSREKHSEGRARTAHAPPPPTTPQDKGKEAEEFTSLNKILS